MFTDIFHLFFSMDRSDLGAYRLRYRLPKNISRQDEVITKVVKGGMRFNFMKLI